MSEEIEKVVSAVRRAGGKLKPLDLVRGKSYQQKRTMQRALQSALDRGLLGLDSDMNIIVLRKQEAHAA